MTRVSKLYLLAAAVSRRDVNDSSAYGSGLASDLAELIAPMASKNLV